jgi:hypothetical protein
MEFGFPCDLTLYKLLTDWGSFIAGVLALVAGFLAYLAGTLPAKNKRRDEVADVREAVAIEIITYAKYVIGALLTCEQVAKGEVQIPRRDANYLAKMLYDSAVYPAVADRTGLLAEPQATVEFYMRIAEAKASANVLAVQTATSGAQSFITAIEASPIADSLITALQLARAIAATAPKELQRSPRHGFILSHTIKEIDQALISARQAFPDAESFKDGMAPADTQP